MKKIIFSLVGLLFLMAGTVHAQQLPHYTQYMYNMNILNPAYAGSKGEQVISFGTLYRTQWYDEPGAPKTLTANVHGAFNESNGIGLSFVKDEYGAIAQNGITVDYSHTLNLGSGKLALGIKTGVNMFTNALSDLYVVHPGDPNFASDIDDTWFTIGAGLFYYTDHYYLSLSVPNFMQNQFNSGTPYEDTDEMHMFLAGGYVFDIGDNFKLKPHFLLFNNIGQKMQADFSINMMFANRFDVGISHRLKDAIIGMFNIRLFNSLRVGYAYDRHVSDIRFYSPTSHEIFINYDWNLNKKVMLSPRYF